jgi:hypothetical protein
MKLVRLIPVLATALATVALSCSRAGGDPRQTGAGIQLSAIAATRVPDVANSPATSSGDAPYALDVRMRLSNSTAGMLMLDEVVDEEPVHPHYFIEGLEDGTWTAQMTTEDAEGNLLVDVNSFWVAVRARSLNAGECIEFTARIQAWMLKHHDKLRVVMEVSDGRGSQRVASQPIGLGSF